MSDTRDYYADLELPPTADEQEIKKQFRKLGEQLACCFEILVAFSDKSCSSKISSGQESRSRIRSQLQVPGHFNRPRDSQRCTEQSQIRC